VRSDGAERSGAWKGNPHGGQPKVAAPYCEPRILYLQVAARPVQLLTIPKSEAIPTLLIRYRRRGLAFSRHMEAPHLLMARTGRLLTITVRTSAGRGS